MLLLSHNGMDVDLKLASRVSGIDVILGGHTHDAVPQPSVVANAGGKTLVTNAGSSGKFLAVLDLDLGKGAVKDVRYRLLPVYAESAQARPANGGADRAPARAVRGAVRREARDRGRIAVSARQFHRPMDQVICDALRHELDAQIALSPGFRWGTTVLPGQAITMERRCCRRPRSLIRKSTCRT